MSEPPAKRLKIMEISELDKLSDKSLLSVCPYSENHLLKWDFTSREYKNYLIDNQNFVEYVLVDDSQDEDDDNQEDGDNNQDSVNSQDSDDYFQVQESSDNLDIFNIDIDCNRYPNFNKTGKYHLRTIFKNYLFEFTIAVCERLEWATMQSWVEKYNIIRVSVLDLERKNKKLNKMVKLTVDYKDGSATYNVPIKSLYEFDVNNYELPTDYYTFSRECNQVSCKIEIGYKQNS